MNRSLALFLALLGCGLATSEPTESIPEIVAGNPDFSTLLAALQAADLVDTLAGEGPFTVFAPNNDAFAKIPEEDLNALLADVPALTAVLLRHVVAANIPVSAIFLSRNRLRNFFSVYFLSFRKKSRWCCKILSPITLACLTFLQNDTSKFKTVRKFQVFVLDASWFFFSFAVSIKMLS